MNKLTRENTILCKNQTLFVFFFFIGFVWDVFGFEFFLVRKESSDMLRNM